MKTIINYINEAKHSFRIKSHLKTDDQDKDCVDLDLPSGLKWATCNVGADKPEEYGDYFAWGETKPKKDYSWKTYKFGSNFNRLNKYKKNDNKDTLDPEDDAVYQTTNGKFRMPTKAALNELLKHTDWQEDTINGVKGAKIVSKKDENKWIFIPFSGYKEDSMLREVNNWFYLWSSSPYSSYPYDACCCFSNADLKGNGGYNRPWGFCVRGVC